jgi:hypothetical protein
VKPTSREVSFIFKEEKMSQICNFSPRNFVTFQDLKKYNSETGGISECGRETVATSAVIPEVDRVISCSDKPQYNCQSFLSVCL